VVFVSLGFCVWGEVGRDQGLALGIGPGGAVVDFFPLRQPSLPFFLLYCASLLCAESAARGYFLALAARCGEVRCNGLGAIARDQRGLCSPVVFFP
jgi:hypothetical protein